MKLAVVYILLAAGVLFSCGQKNNAGAQSTKADTTIPVKDTITPIAWITDRENIFTKEQVVILDSIISDHKKQTGNEIVVVTFTPDSTQHIVTDEEFAEFAQGIFNKWGVGEREKNNGIGILVSTKLRKVRIAVGNGLESRLTDPEAQLIINDLMIPFFKNGAYFYGVENAIEAIIREIK